MPKRRYVDDGEIEGGIGESKYERLVRTRLHRLCMWDEHGEKCENPAVRLTAVLAMKTKQLPGGLHASVLHGGYCDKHSNIVAQRESYDSTRGGQDWRDKLVNSVLVARGFTPEGG